jgi:hypothetical protein
LVASAALKYDKLQFEAYLFAASRPALKAEVEAAVAMTWRPHNTIVTASRRDDLGWAAPILTALADGFGLSRIALSNYEGGFRGLREGLLALMESLPGNPPDWLASDQPVKVKARRTKASGKSSK